MGMPYGALRLIEKTELIRGLMHQLNAQGDKSLSCLMMGRSKMTLTDVQIASFLKRNSNLKEELLHGWSDDLLRHLGCEKVESLDFSDFEGADFCWNLNESVRARKFSDKKFSLILDYGTTEHIFNPGMSVFNASDLLEEGGVYNLMLPTCGWIDHGFYQFSPSFFYAIDRQDFKLERLYFWVYDRTSSNLVMWDGLTDEFKEHVHGAFDGSFAANCLEYLNMPVMAWAVFRKNAQLDEKDFMLNTHQLVYRTQWKQNELVNQTNPEKIKIYHSNHLLRPYLMRKFLKRISTPIESIPSYISSL